MSNESSSTRIRAEIDDLRYKVANVEAAMRKKSLKPQRLMSLGNEHRNLVLQKKAKERELAMERNAENAEIDRQNRLAVEMEMGNVAENRPHERRQMEGTSDIARREAGKVFTRLTSTMDEKRDLERRMLASDVPAAEKEEYSAEILEKQRLIVALYSEYLDRKIDIYTTNGNEKGVSVLSTYRKGFFIAAFLLQIIGVALVSTLVARVGKKYLVESPSQSFLVSNTGYDVLKQIDFKQSGDSEASPWLSIQYSFSGMITQLRLGEKKAWIARSSTDCQETNAARSCEEETTREFSYPVEFSAMSWDACEKTVHGDFNISSTVFDEQEGWQQNSTYVSQELPARLFNSSYQYFLPLAPNNVRECELALVCRQAKNETYGLLIGGLIFVLLGIAVQIQRVSLDSKLGTSVHAGCLLIGVLMVGISMTVFPDKCISTWDAYIRERSEGQNPVFSMARSFAEQWYPLYAQCPGDAPSGGGEGYSSTCGGSGRASTILWLWTSTITVLGVLLVAVPVITSGSDSASYVHKRKQSLQEVMRIEQATYGVSDVFPEHDYKASPATPPKESLEMALLRVNHLKIQRQQQQQNRNQKQKRGSEVQNVLHNDAIPPVLTL